MTAEETEAAIYRALVRVNGQPDLTGDWGEPTGTEVSDACKALGLDFETVVEYAYGTVETTAAGSSTVSVPYAASALAVSFLTGVALGRSSDE